MADDLKDAEKELSKADTVLADAEEKLAAAQREHAAAVAAHDAALEAARGPEDPQQQQKDIMAYIHRQSGFRAERAERSKELLDKLGADAADIDPRSPIDAAMARKTKRGAARPATPAKAD